MESIKDILFMICENQDVYKENIDLIDSGLLDSLAIIRLFSYFEDNNIEIQITRIDRNKLRTVKGIEELVSDYLESDSSIKER